MAEQIQMNTAWLASLSNPHHDGTTQQIYDFAHAYQTDNARYQQKVAALGQCRQTEDEVWLKAQRDDAVKTLEAADKDQDAYMNAARFINKGYTFLPASEAQQAEAKQVEQVFLDYKFHVTDSYGAEADKIIQMAQNPAAHEAFLTQIGAWQWYQKAITAANQVRQALGERAFTMGQAVNGEMKAVRRATDVAIADLYRTIEAMNELMPSDELTTLITQLKGIELYAKQYYLNNGTSTGTGTGTGTNANANPNPNPNDNSGNPSDSSDSGNSGSGDNPSAPSDPSTGGGGDNGGGTIIDGADEG
jgi:hypothetical protein